MGAIFFTVILGIICVILGISNMMGNISSLHSYHRHRVSEQDVRPFGRLVGLGTIIIGISIAVFGVLTYLGERSGSDALVFVSTGVLIAGIVVGIILSFYAMIKYNKGIF